MKLGKNKRKRRLFPALAVVLGFSLMGGFAAYAEELNENDTSLGEGVTTPVSQAVISHTPLHYTYDYTQDLGQRITLEGSEAVYGDWNNLPILFPGDTVTIIPKIPSASQASRNGDTISGHSGVVFINPNGAESRDPVHVTKVAQYGMPREAHDNSFIQEFEITGTEPVMVFSNGGGGYTSESVVHAKYSNITLAYYASNLEFKYYPNYCQLAYQYADINSGAEAGIFDDEFLAKELHYYSDAKEMDAVWSTDAIHNMVRNYKGDDLVTYTVRRPYIEGYYVEKVITSNRESHAYRIQSNTKFDETTDTMTITPGWGDSSRTGGDYTRKGDYAEDWTQVRFEFLAGRTLTLEACGGTIGGYPSRIYIANGNDDKVKIEKLSEAGALTPEREGYLFLGWYEDDRYETPVTDLWTTISKYGRYNSSPRQDRICRVYAKWQKLGWDVEAEKRVYYDNDGTRHTGWLTDNGKKYYFDEDGYMKTGMVQDGTKWYFFDKKNGYMKTGWVQDGTKWYFFDKKAGYMKTGWVQDGKKWYFFDKKDGYMKTGWVQDGKKWYFFDKKDGYMKTNAWVQDGKKWYYFKGDGTMAQNEWCKGYWLNKDGTQTYKYTASWKKDKTGWYFIDTSGWYAKNQTLTIDGKKYTFDAKGYLK